MGPKIFATLTKVDEEKRMVFGRIAQEMVDKSDEVMDYEASKPHFKKWSDEMSADTGGRNLGNVRAMHGKVAAGAVKMMDFNDVEKAIDVGAHIVDDNEWKKVLAGVYTGFSIGGSYVGAKIVQKVDGKDVTRYTAKPNEVSLVDRPCIPSAKFFEVQKMDGTKEQVEFQKGFPPKDEEEAAEDPKEEEAEAEAMTQEEIDAKKKAGEAAGNLATDEEACKIEPVYEVKGSDSDIGAFAKILNDADADMASVNKFLSVVLETGTLQSALEKISAAPVGLTKLDTPNPEASVSGAAEPLAKSYSQEEVDALVAAAKEPELNKLDEGALQKAVLAATSPLLERLNKLEAMPAAPTVRLRALSKGEDFGLVNEALQKRIEENLNPPAIVDAHGDKHEAAGLIKSLHRMGGSPLMKGPNL